MAARRHVQHALGIDRAHARELGLNIVDLEEDQELQDAVLSVHHATIHTFAGMAVKLIENHLGRAYVELQPSVQIQQIQVPTPGLPVLPGPPG